MSFKGEIIVPAYAKINLFLDITGKADNGYHNLYTVMQRISLCDTVRVRLCDKEGISVYCDREDIPCGEKNIAYKAARIFFEKTGLSVGAEIHISKKIPVMAGLGGGSADAAAVLTALNGLCRDVLSGEELEKSGAEAGADIPFCIRGGTAVCEGIGDKMTSIKGLDNEMFLLIVKPDFSCDTAAGYRKYDEKPVGINEERNLFISALKDENYDEVYKRFYNVFEVIYEDERIERLKAALLRYGAKGACLTGSGSAVFSIFQTYEQAKTACEKIEYEEKFIVSPM